MRANAVAYLALFVALGGTSYAASQLPKNSVDSKQIAPNAVGKSEIKPGGVGPTELAAKSVGSGKLRAGIIAPEHVRPGIISPEHLGFGVTRANLDGARTTEAKPIKQSSGFAPAGTATVQMIGKGSSAVITGAVEVTASGGDALVTVRVRHNDHVEPVVFKETVVNGATGTVPVSLLCNWKPGDPAANNFTLEVSAVTPGTVTLGGRSIDAVSFRSIPNPP
jgi:hypothetical protein